MKNGDGVTTTENNRRHKVIIKIFREQQQGRYGGLCDYCLIGMTFANRVSSPFTWPSEKMGNAAPPLPIFSY